MTIKEAVERHILKYPLLTNNAVANQFNTTKGNVAFIKHGMRKKGKLKPFDRMSLRKHLIKKQPEIKHGGEAFGKILILDIETAPLSVFVWDIWKQDVGTHMIQTDWFILTWAAKWLFETKVYSGMCTSKEAKKQDDKRMVKGIWALLNEADIVIAHNGDKFDLPRLNTKFLMHGLNPPLPYQSIDTLKHIRRQFSFISNKLDYVNTLLNLPRKMETNIKLWKDCYMGKESSLKKMLAYNIGDVKILEETYLRIRPYIKPHPNVALHILDEGQFRCPSCGSSKMNSQGKDYHTTTNVYELLRCVGCGATARKRNTTINIKQKRFITVSNPK